MEEYNNKLITLSDGNKYVILNHTTYNEKTYALLNDVENGKLGENLTIYRVEDNNGEKSFIVERDLDIVEKLLDLLSN